MSNYPARDSLRRAAKWETKVNGNALPFVDAVWAMRDKVMEKNNLERRYEIVLTKNTIAHIDRAARKIVTYSR